METAVGNQRGRQDGASGTRAFPNVTSAKVHFLIWTYIVLRMSYLHLSSFRLLLLAPARAGVHARGVSQKRRALTKLTRVTEMGAKNTWQCHVLVAEGSS